MRIWDCGFEIAPPRQLRRWVLLYFPDVMDKKTEKDIRPLTSAEFEKYVGELVRTLHFARDGKVHTNKSYKGIRQPGTYEIDVSLELQLADALKFLLIVECKNWKRPVDRPVIQKFAQTRDAINADKAAVVSPVGFTKEAQDVAQTLGVALWIITLQEWIVAFDNAAVGFSYTAHSEDTSRDWHLSPPKTGLVKWGSPGIKLYPPHVDLPESLDWARFMYADYYNHKEVDAHFELVRTIQQKLLGIDDSNWWLRLPRLHEIGPWWE